MKKLLSIAFCAAAASVFADTQIEVADVGVTMVTLPAGQANTIIAASFKELANPSSDISIANIVKTSSLAAGDQLLLFTANDTYAAWELNSSGEWVKANKTYTINSSGQLVEGAGDAPDTTTAVAGKGLWIVRKNASAAASIALYGAYIADSKSTTTTAGAWNLIGNAAQSSFNGFTGVAGDKIVRVVNGALVTYSYKAGDGKGWYYTSYETVEGVAKATKVYGTPAIAAGEGFWYYTQSAKTLTWGN